MAVEFVVASLPMACVVTDPDGSVLEVNTVFESQFAIAPDAIVSTRIGDLFAGGSRIFFHTHVIPLLMRQGYVENIACHVRSASGNRLPAYVFGKLIPSSEGDVCLWLFFGGVDRQNFESALVTARKQAERQSAELKDAYARLQSLQGDLEAQVRKTEAANRLLSDLALRDSLTQLGNRRALEQHVDRRKNATAGELSAILMIDVDHFKSINDRFGHDHGDTVLRELAACLRAVARKDDFAFRYGGEEFLLLLTNASLEGAQAFAVRLHDHIADARPGGLEVTVSIGLAMADLAIDTLPASITRADAALYGAKRGGRNQTIVSPQERIDLTVH